MGIAFISQRNADVVLKQICRYKKCVYVSMSLCGCIICMDECLSKIALLSSPSIFFSFLIFPFLFFLVSCFGCCWKFFLFCCMANFTIKGYSQWAYFLSEMAESITKCSPEDDHDLTLTIKK